MTSESNGNITTLPDFTMYVADMLSNDSEAIPTIIGMMNSRSGGWRNSVTCDFTAEDVILALDQLVKHGLVEPIPRDMTAGWINESIDESDLPEDVRQQWFRLTLKGRQALDVWEPPKSLEDRLIELVQTASMPLYTAYHRLMEHIGEDYSFEEFSQLVNHMLENETIQLSQTLHTPDKLTVSPDLEGSGDSEIQVNKVPGDLGKRYADIGQKESTVDVFGYILTIGPAANQPLQPFESIAQIPNPVDVLEKIVQYSFILGPWVRERGSVRHFVINEENGITARKVIPEVKPEYEESMLEAMARRRLNRGMPGIERVIIRHIVVDAENQIIGDYYGLAITDPLAY